MLKIARIINEQNEELARINQEIDRVQSLVLPLMRQRDKIKASIEAHKGLTAVSRRIPSEIWGEVFVQCLPADASTDIDFREAPLLLTQICRAWRSISISMPKLWNSISLSYNDHLPSAPESALIQTWIMRSGNLPLSIELHRTDHWKSLQWSDGYIELLVAHAPRIQEISGHLTTRAANKLLACQHIHELKTLRLVDAHLHVGQFLEISKSATGLRNIALEGQIEGMAMQLQSIPCAQLTTFDISCVLDISDCFDIFRECYNLTKLSLWTVSGRPSEQVHSKILMPNLDVLTLRTEAGIDHLWDNLTLPKLRKAYFACAIAPWPKESLFGLVERSRCPLTKLIVDYPEVSNKDLMDLAYHITSLLELKTGRLISIRSIPEEAAQLFARRRNISKESSGDRS